MNDWLQLSWDMNLDYGLRLVADVPDDRMIFQPRPAMNHPAWVLCHLCHYHPAILALVRGEPFQDPRETPDASRYDEGSVPVSAASQYPAKAVLLERFTQGHDSVSAALRQMDVTQHLAPPSLDRWRKTFGTVGGVLAYLMLTHESTHLGQISTWRRVQGLPRV